MGYSSCWTSLVRACVCVRVRATLCSRPQAYAAPAAARLWIVFVVAQKDKSGAIGEKFPDYAFLRYFCASMFIDSLNLVRWVESVCLCV